MATSGSYLYQLAPDTPDGYEYSSLAYYCMQHWPEAISILLDQMCDGDVERLKSWIAGFAYGLALVEDCGYPIDLDMALHGWQEDIQFDLAAAIRQYRENR